MNRAAWLLIAVLFFTSACRSKKLKVEPISKNIESVIVTPDGLADFHAKLAAANFDFTYLAAKAKVTFEQKGKNTSVNFSVRMKKDETIWISVNAIGTIEVARVLLSRDSVKILDRINNKYIVTDYDQISELLKVQADFQMIQQLITGSVSDPQASWSELAKTMDAISWKFITEDHVRSEYFIDPITYKPRQLDMHDTEQKQSLTVNYGDYRPVGTYLFPFLINSYAVSQKESVKLDVQYTKVEKVDALDFPFNVPKKFD